MSKKKKVKKVAFLKRLKTFIENVWKDIQELLGIQ